MATGTSLAAHVLRMQKANAATKAAGYKELCRNHFNTGKCKFEANGGKCWNFHYIDDE